MKKRYVQLYIVESRAKTHASYLREKVARLFHSKVALNESHSRWYIFQKEAGWS